MFDLATPQKNVVETEQFFKNTGISNIGGYAVFGSFVDFKIMEKAINKLIENADGLRIHLSISNGEVKQYISDYTPISAETVKISKKDVLNITNEWMSKQFELDGDLYDFKLLQYEDGQGIFIKLHHVISDAWSMAMVYSKVVEYYEKLSSNEKIEDEIPSYKLFIDSEKEYLESESYVKDKEYWDAKYENKPVYVSLSNRSGIVSPVANRKSFFINKDERKEIEEYCSNNKISEAVFFEAVVSLYASRINNTDEVTLCTIGINRSGRIQRNIVGMFNNILPMTVKLDWENTFLDLCGRITRNHYEIFRHQKYPYANIMNSISERHGTSNIYDIMVSFQNAKFDKDLKTKYVTHWNFNGYAELSFMVNIDDLQNTGGYDVNIDYKLESFEDEQINDIYKRLKHIIKQVLTNKEICFKDIEIVTPEEKKKILKDFNDTKVPYPKEKRLFDFLEEMAKEKPDKDALYFEGNKLTYGEFNEKVNALANYMIDNGIKGNAIIGIMAERSFEMLIAIYATLKVGCSYMPMDPNFPEERIEFMIKDSMTPVILAQSKWKTNLPKDANIIAIDEFNYNGYSKENPNVLVSSNDVAYVIYTSGSTGKPKGAQIEHHSAINRIKWMHGKYPLESQDVILQKTPYTFDVSVWELFWWSMYGGSLKILIPEGHKDPLEIINAIYESKITHMHFVPSMLNAFLQYVECNKYLIPKLKTLKYVFASGEALQCEYVKKFYELLGENGTTLHNLYGPTECTVDVSYYDCPKDNIPDSIPIGKPVDNTELLILDKANKLLPIGIAGELIISGVLVGRGYIKRDELTNEKFIPNEYFESKKMYKTGDLARWLPDGNIEYLGRIDNQVKIRGLRVELGDIENAILKFRSIVEVVVTVFENLGEKYLCAYYTSTEPISVGELEDYLNKELPEYMVPTYYVELEKMPLNHNGKIDRKQLPKPDTSVKEEYVEPKNDLEREILGYIAKILNRDKISVESDLMTSGLTSLGVISLITGLSSLGIEVKVQDFYRGKTIRKLAEYISNQTQNNDEYVDDENYIDVSDIENIDVKVKEDGDILLTGATGFLGIHLLEELYYKTSKDIYCLIRNPKKFDELIKTYTTIPENDKRIITFVGNIVDEKLGLDESEYSKLKERIGCIIHSAANVSYFCEWEKARLINYIGTCNMIKFAEASKAKLHHISTMSVSGDILTAQTKEYPQFSEKDLYIGQLYKNNVYTYSKYLAEKEVIKNIRDKKISACIYRLPNLTWRMKDGVFQRNFNENDLYIMTKVMYRLNKVPLEIKDENILLTPVDDLSSAIVSLMQNVKENRIFHLVSTSSPTIYEYMKLICDVTPEPIIDLYNKLKEFPDDKDMQFVSMYLSGILRDAKKMVVHVNYDKTAKLLNDLGFKWGTIDKKYAEYFKTIGNTKDTH